MKSLSITFYTLFTLLAGLFIFLNVSQTLTFVLMLLAFILTGYGIFKGLSLSLDEHTITTIITLVSTLLLGVSVLFKLINFNIDIDLFSISIGIAAVMFSLFMLQNLKK